MFPSPSLALLLFFSRAIMCYLVNKYATDEKPAELMRLYPKDPEMRANVDKLLYFDTGSLYKSIVDYFVSIHTYTRSSILPRY